MNRIGLAIALTTAVVVGLLFAFDPRLDLALSAPFFRPSTHLFVVNAQAWVGNARNVARTLITLLVAPAGLALVGKLIFPRRRILIPGRAAWFLLVTLALGPGILANQILKDHWGRARPIDLVEFGGADHFTPWWDPRGACPNNCSFIAGEPSGAFWTLAPAALAPPQWRPLAYAAALGFGVAVSLLRVAGGAHFFTDVVFAGIFMFLVAWVLHGLIYRWRPTRITDDTIEQPLARAGQAIRDRLSALCRRIGARGGASP